jgi:peptidoglycan/xylan/chitin deacetylase (PgdA/CDA1 family)
MGRFVISLDFELHWGVRDKRTLSGYRDNLLGVRKAIPAMLDKFDEFGIRATVATVGFLFFDRRDELLAALPARRPSYENALLSPYEAMDEVGEDEAADPYHFGRSLLAEIGRRGHEVASHTFSHYSCLERGQTLEEFAADLDAARAAGTRDGFDLVSLVFPRNQYDAPHLSTCSQKGFRAFRGNPRSWIYAARRRDQETRVERALRLLDAYVNLSGDHSASDEYMRSFAPVNVPGSRYLRPYSRALRLLEPLRLRRIRNAMTRAARRNETFHLWWHPHDFGVNTVENIAVLDEVLRHHAHLQDRYGWRNATMGQTADELSPFAGATAARPSRDG